MDLLELSGNIRRLRLSQKMTVEQLAAKSAFSKGFISQVENFRITPSLNALNRIAGALGVSLPDLFQQDHKAPVYTFGNLSDGEELFRDDNIKFGIRYFALAYRQIGRKMNPFVIEYTPSKEEREFMMHDTEEFFLLLEGELDYFLMDDRTVRRMKKGEFLYMQANT
ncbi:MAG: helix-turn-helix transcriptional regulator, partial [Lentisphaeria bacterium]|nr:helix-turn-helix transcriptional regulator [Lentisphaeria bacterium]